MEEEEERVRKLDEQSVRRPASQSQLFNPRQGSLDWVSGRAGGRVSKQEFGPTVITKHSDTMSSAYVLSILRSWPIFQTHHNTPWLSLPRRKSRLFFNLFHLLSEKGFVFFKARRRIENIFLEFAEPSPTREYQQ